jgi:exodeoxyribonuclease III
MRVATWNINGIRAAIAKGSLLQFVTSEQPDVLCLQELRASDADAALCLLQDHMLSGVDNHHRHPSTILVECPKDKKGYSGVAIVCFNDNNKPLRWWPGLCMPPNIDDDDVDVDVNADVRTNEDANANANAGIDVDTDKPRGDDWDGRVLTAVFERHVVVSIYSPNSGVGTLKNLQHRIESFEPELRSYLEQLGTWSRSCDRCIIVAGDLNVAAEDIDIHDPKGRHKMAGFTPQERAAFASLLADTGLLDTFRSLHPHTRQYTYWSNFARSRERNKGWRIDYILLAQEALPRVQSICIKDQVKGSDHAPVVLDIEDGPTMDPQSKRVPAPKMAKRDLAACLRAQQIREMDKESVYGARAYQNVIDALYATDKDTISIADALGLPGVGPKIRASVECFYSSSGGSNRRRNSGNRDGSNTLLQVNGRVK